MNTRTWAVAVFTVLILLAYSRTADACSCLSPGPACQAFWTADAVFDATVESIDGITRPDSGGSPFLILEHMVRLTVREAWKGVQPGALEVVTNSQGSACGYSFKVAQRYLVFASKRAIDGRWTVSLCSLTQPYNGSGEAAEFLASLRLPPLGGRVFGSVTLNERTFDPDRPSVRRPVDTPVRLLGGGQNRSTMSQNGRYEFTGLAAGGYRVELQLPSGYTTHQDWRNVNVPNGHACAREDYYLAPDTRITGRVVGQDGRPVGRQTIEATVPDASPRASYGLSTATADTTPEGYFEFRGLSPGKYILGVNLKDLPNQYNRYARTLYPSEGNDVHELSLSLGQTVDVGTWRLPAPLAVVKVMGVITWQDGTPAAGVYVSASDRTGNPTDTARGAGGATADAEGRFVIALRAGRIYTFSAQDRRTWLPITAPRLETTGAIEPIRIVIQRGPSSPVNGR